MLVALQNPAREATPARLKPIGTEAVFAEEWLPMADLIAAIWLRRLQTGVDVRYDDPAQVMCEFKGAGAQFFADGRPPLVSRAMVVVEALREAVAGSRSNATYFIG